MDFIGIGGSLLCFVGTFLVIGLILMASAIRIVPENKRLRVTRLGQELGEKGPGIVILIPMIDRADVIDLNSQTTREIDK